MFIDHALVHLKAGNGGNGCESYDKRGPRKFYPNGGDGGKGGDIIIRADTNVSDLNYFKFNPHQEAASGQQGSGNKKTGKQGADLILKVPPGTTVYSKEEHYVIRDLVQGDDEVIVVRGGGPGHGNSDNRTATHGKDGETLDILLEYQMLCDVALIGTPNSGKSTFLAKVTHAKVKAADYPFATRIPQLGAYEYEDYTQIMVCDLPSLISGSAEGKGIGNLFLKHARRAKVLYYFLDPLSEDVATLHEGYAVLRRELQVGDETLAKKPYIIIINKADCDVTAAVQKSKETLEKKYKHVYNISAKTGEGIEAVLAKTKELLA